MKTRKALLEEKDKLQAEIDVLFNVYRIPTIAKASARLNKLIANQRDKDKPELDKLQQQLTDIKNVLAARESASRVFVPEHVQKRVQKMCAGIDYGKTEIRWVSPTGRFIIFSTIGRTAWSGVGCTAYYPSTHQLVDLEGGIRFTDKTVPSFYMKVTGRLSKAQFNKMIAGTKQILNGTFPPATLAD